MVKGRGKGHSDDHLPALESSYIEALAMAQSAIDAIEAVKNGRRTNQIRTSKTHKKAKMLLKMFGIRAAGLFRPEFREFVLSTRNQGYLWLFTRRSYDLKDFVGSYIAEVYQTMIQEAHGEYISISGEPYSMAAHVNIHYTKFFLHKCLISIIREAYSEYLTKIAAFRGENWYSVYHQDQLINDMGANHEHF